MLPPDPQNVVGTVTVAKLPAVQQVAGSVEVTSFPVSSGMRVFQCVGLVARAPFDRHLPSLGFSLPAKTEVTAASRELLETGKLTPVIDRTYPLSEAPAAMRYMRDGGVLGRIILTP